MPNCPYCDAAIDEAYNFCINCERQVKCMQCNSYLIKDKSKCLKCGSILTAPKSDAPPMNNFSLEEEQSNNSYSRKINFAFTNDAIDKVASVIGGYIPLNSPVVSKTKIQSQQQLTLPFAQAEEYGDHASNPESVDEEIVETTARNISEDGHPDSYFEKDAQGFLISIDRDYRGKTKKLQQQRFSILYIWAYYAMNGQPVPTDHLNQAAQRNGIHDQNYGTHLKDIIGRHLTKLDHTLKLNPSGISESKKIQQEMQDSDLSGYEYWNTTTKRVSRTSRTTNEKAQKIEQWIKISSRFSNFDVRRLKSAAEYAILALFDITKEIKAEDAVKPSLAYEYLVRKFLTIPYNKKLFTDTINHKRYQNYFQRTPEGLAYLTQEAESIAGSWIEEEGISNP